MAIRTNSYYTNPQIGQAFEGLASMFAPPSAGEINSYAQAAATRQKMATLDQLARMAQDPNLNQSVFDRLGQAAGQWSPAAGYYGVNTGAATSRANNAADNARALEQTRMQQQGDTARAMLAPVGAGATRFVPPALADLYQVPGQQVGVLSANPGETVSAPDGRVLNGTPKPMTESELKAVILGGMPLPAQQAAAMGSTPVENIVDVVSGQPRIAYRSDAVGQQPYIAPTAGAKPTNGMAVMPDGTRVPAVQGPTGRWAHAQTGQPLPDNVQVFDMPRPQGSAVDVGVPTPTTANQTSANNRAAEVTRTLATLDLYENLIRQNPGAQGIVGLLRGTTQNAMASAQDLAASFGRDIPQVNDAVGVLRSELNGVAPELFDPSISQAEFLRGVLAYAKARTENPSGEVSRTAFDRALADVGGGWLSNSQDTLAKLAAWRQTLGAEQSAIGALRQPGTARTDTAGPTPAASTTGQATGPVRVSTPEEARRLPSGTRIIMPDGSEGRVP